VDPMADRKVDFLLIGGGLAAGNCARWLREDGAEGTILVVGREPDAPYNRPNCSKGYLRGEEERHEALFRPDEWWDEQDIELLRRTSVMSLDAGARTVKLSTKEEVEFDKALLATGANVHRLNVDGAELEGIHYLRTLANSDAIRQDAEGTEHVVLIGGSYIACEVAASLTMLGKRCTMVMQEEHTLERGFGKQAGMFFQRMLEDHGVEIHPQDELARFEGDGRVASIHTRNGLSLEAETVVIGAGVAPDVHLAQRAGIEIGERGGVRCSAQLESSVAGIFAAGDICEYESPVHDGARLRIEHWDVAFNQGKTTALNMLGRGVEHTEVPYFFSDLGDWGGLEYVGPAFEWDEEIVRGSYEAGEFTTWYLHKGHVRAALAVGRSDDLDHARRLIGSALSADERAELARIDSDLAGVGS
jgi:3-phenylpropionate/trans-cinnamate dioxygenase ferredoxin reductase component